MRNFTNAMLLSTIAALIVSFLYWIKLEIFLGCALSAFGIVMVISILVLRLFDKIVESFMDELLEEHEKLSK